MATAELEAKPASEQAAKIVRPALEPGEKDYSAHHDSIYCAIEINAADARGKITKIGHITSIIDAHFPNAAEVYKAHDELLTAIKSLVECCEKQRAFHNPKNTITRDRLYAAQRAIARAEQQH